MYRKLKETLVTLLTVAQVTDIVGFAVICNIYLKHYSHKFGDFYSTLCTNDSHLGCGTV